MAVIEATAHHHCVREMPHDAIRAPSSRANRALPANSNGRPSHVRHTPSKSHCGAGNANLRSSLIALAGVFAWLAQWAQPAWAQPQHAIAMHGSAKHAPGFTHFPYVDPQAPKGGRVTLGYLGSFDSLNPYIIRGVSPPSLRELVFESLLARSGDEPFSLYGLIAETIEVAPDRSAITFNLNPAARFSDGTPVTPEDVIFSHAVLKVKGFPYHRAHYGKVRSATITGPRSVRFTFAPIKDEKGADVVDREMPLILGLMPVLPRHKLSLETFEQTSLEAPVGSGPYVVGHVDAGRSITYRRNRDWWGRELPVSRGRFNFDEVRIEFFRDIATLFEAFKTGEIDVRPEDDPARWIEGYGFPAVTEGRVLKRELTTSLPSGMTALVLNGRRDAFKDARVRRAFLLMFDGEWINRSLYSGAFRRTRSFFDRSYLAAAGRPADARERALLAPFPGAVKPDVLEGTYVLPTTSGSGDDRANLQAAFRLLKEAGYVQAGRQLVKDGVPLKVELLAANRQQERLMVGYTRTLERLGVTASVRQVDAAQYFARLRTYDYDIMQWNWSASLSPGNEQVNRWSSRSADIEGSLNYAGVKNAAADAMIEAMLNATNEEDFTAAVRAFDRVLISGDYVVPLFHLPAAWVAHWSHLKLPATLPLAGYDLDSWWTEKR